MLTSDVASTNSATERDSAESGGTGGAAGTGTGTGTGSAEADAGSAEPDERPAETGRALARQSPHAGIMVTRVGLEMPALLEFGAWEQAGLKIARIADSSAWCLGDWLIYGQNVYADRYRHAVTMAGLDYQTLRNYAWVARRFERSRRRERLSFQHHAEVAAFPAADQDRWLDCAEQGGWSRNQLRASIRVERRPAQAAVERPELPKLCPAAEQVAKWQQAAERRSQDLADWIVATLDDGALRALSERTERLRPMVNVG